MAHAVDPDEVSEEVCRSVEELTEFLTDALCKGDLKSLITEDGVWKGFVEAAELSSEEEAALYDSLKKNLEQEPTDEDDGPQREQLKEQFLQVFPQLKKKLEEHIKKLRDLADHLDKVHRGCAISNVVSGSVVTASGLLGILGFTLAPITGGASLILSATSIGLGATAAVSSVVTNTVEESMTRSGKSEASRLVRASIEILEEILKITPKITIKLYNSGKELFKAFVTIRHQIQVIRAARNLTSAGRRSVQSGRILGAAFRGVRIEATVVRCLFLAWDVYDFVEQSEVLYDGAKAESVGALRDLCLKLEEKLKIFEQISTALQADLPQ